MCLIRTVVKTLYSLLFTVLHKNQAKIARFAPKIKYFASKMRNLRLKSYIFGTASVNQ